MKLFNGNYKAYYQHVRTHEIYNNGMVRIKRNFSNLGLWCVKDSQKRITINLGVFRIQLQ